MGAMLPLIARLSAGLFAGAASYVSVVEHPAWMWRVTCVWWTWMANWSR